LFDYAWFQSGLIAFDYLPSDSVVQALFAEPMIVAAVASVEQIPCLEHY
jgi:hypothetical protein